MEEAEQTEVEEFFEKNKEDVLNQVKFLLVAGQISADDVTAVYSGIGYDLVSGAKIREPRWVWNTLAGIPLEKGDLNSKSIVIGKRLAEILGCTSNVFKESLSGALGYPERKMDFECPTNELSLSAVTEKGQSNMMRTKVAGITSTGFMGIDDVYIAMSLPLAQRLNGTKKISYYSVELTDSSEVAFFRDKFNEQMKSKGLSLHAVKWQDHAFGDLFVRTIDWLSMFEKFVIVIVLVIAGLSVFITLSKIVMERTKEIGTLRSVGFQDIHIFRIFLAESMMLAGAGIVLGILISLALTAIINGISIPYKAGFLSEPVPFRVAIYHKAYFASAFILFFISIVASMLATSRSLRLKIVDAINFS